MHMGRQHYKIACHHLPCRLKLDEPLILANYNRISINTSLGGAV